VLNAANEVAVDAFLQGRIGFMQIAHVNSHVLERLGHEGAGESLEAVEALDGRARTLALTAVASTE